MVIFHHTSIENQQSKFLVEPQILRLDPVGVVTQTVRLGGILATYYIDIYGYQA